MNHSASVTDLRYRTPTASRIELLQTENTLADLGTPPLVIDWVFHALQEQESECACLRRTVADLEARLPEQ
jgi:hypothetical protein